MVVKRHRIHTKRNALLFVGVAVVVALVIIIVGIATGRKSTVHITGSNLAYYIDKYNSFYNGYNNTLGNFNTDDGIEEFENILNQYSLEYSNGELRRLCDE